MSRNEKDNFVATKEEKTFDDNGNIQVANAKTDNKKSLNIIRQKGIKAKDYPGVSKYLKKPAKVIKIKLK
tara:strand:+ start:160 stop:369 length:210 start_codon:yes stop_codon:yes gene_type:complete